MEPDNASSGFKAKRLSSKPSDPTRRDEPAGFVARCTIIGGPNGSGKSSLFESLRADGEFVNADIIARGLDPFDPSRVERAAAKAALDRLNELLRDRKDFVFETTLSGNHPIILMKRANEAKYEVGLVYVVLSGVDLNVARVQARVKQGGHDIPEPIIRRRYPKSLKNLARAIPLAHGCLIYDNSKTKLSLLLRLSGSTIVENHLDGAATHHVSIAATVAQALGSSSEAIIRSSRGG